MNCFKKVLSGTLKWQKLVANGWFLRALEPAKYYPIVSDLL